MSIEELFEKYYKTQEQCAKLREIDRQIDEEELELVRKYESYPNHGVGNCEFKMKLEEIHRKSTENAEHYMEALKAYGEAAKTLLNTVEQDE